MGNTIFTDNPVNWIKWAVVIIFVVVAYIPTIKMYKKLSYKTDKERKIEKAVAKGHVIEATFVSFFINENRKYSCTYEYEINGKKHKFYRALSERPPQVIYLYYTRSSRRFFLFTDVGIGLEDYRPALGCLFLFLTFLPFLLGGLLAWMLGLVGK